jgi:hypothetical protein
MFCRERLLALRFTRGKLFDSRHIAFKRDSRFTDSSCMYFLRPNLSLGLDLRVRLRSIATGLLAVFVIPWSGTVNALMITEVQFDPVAFFSDAGEEFVEIYNDEGVTLDLTGYSIGWGGADYTFGIHDLDAYGLLDPGDVIVIGGPTDATGFDFVPELENGFLFAAGGVAVFDVESGLIAGATPVDALIYGTVFVFGNTNNLIDETGGVGAVDIVTAGSAENAARDAGGNWIATTTSSPGTTPVPEPGTAILVGIGLACLAGSRRVRTA